MTAPIQSLVVMAPEQLAELIKKSIEDTLLGFAGGVSEPEVLDVDGACKLLNCSRTTLHRLRADGLPERRLCDSPRFLRSELLAWLDAQTPNGKHTPTPMLENE